MLDPAKRQMILKEIEYWRDNKLLPEQYCDFLKNLYMDHDSVEAEKRKAVRWRKLLSVIGTTSFFLLFVFYFTFFHPVLQTLFALIVAGALHGLGMTAGSRPVAAYTLHGAASLFLLLSGILILNLNGYDDAGAAVGLIAVCGALWIFVGALARIPLLQLCGWICLLMAQLLLIPLLHGKPGWVILQLHTVPVAAALMAAGRSRMHRGKQGAAVLLIASALYFLSAEIYGIFFTEISGVLLHPVLALKIMLLAIAAWAVWRAPNTPEWLDDHE